MATTTNYGWTTPNDTDYVKDGASAIRTLGSAIDTSVKSLSPGTTAGDVDYYTSSTAKARIGIGSTGQVLTVSGGVPTWSSPSGLASMLNPKVVGSYSSYASTATTSMTMSVNRTYYYPVFITSGAFDRIAIRTSATHTGTTSVRLGLYNASLTTGLPTTVLFDAGTVSCTAASTLYTITISQTPATGWYYLAGNAQSISAVASFFSQGAAPSSVFALSADLSVITPTFYQDSVTGAFATATSLVAQSTVPSIGLRNA